jgi:hypothetical protein
MARTALAAALLVPLTLVAACGGGSSSPASSAAGASAATPTTATDATQYATPSPLAGKSAVAVWKESLKAAHAAESVHIVGNGKDGKDALAVDLQLSSDKATGTLVIDDGKMTVRRTGTTLYFMADAKFWRASGADAATVTRLANKWVKADSSEKNYKDFFELTDKNKFIDQSLSLDKSDQAILKLVPGILIGNQFTVGLFDAATGKGSDDQPGVLYVASSGPSLPLRVVGKDKKALYLNFVDWNKDISVTIPSGVTTI